MKFNELDFNELLINDFYYRFQKCKFNNSEISEMLKKVNKVLKSKLNNNITLAEAYVIKFQLLSYKYKLYPKLLYKALELIPEMPDALLRMCVVYYLKDDETSNENNINTLNNIIDKNPDFPISYLIRCFVVDDNKKQNLYDIKEYIKLKPDDMIGYELLYKLIYSNIEDFITFSAGPINKDNDELEKKEKIQNLNELIECLNNQIRIETEDFYFYNRAKMYIERYDLLNNNEDLISALEDINKYFFQTPIIDLVDYISKFDNLFSGINNKVKINIYEEIMKKINKDNVIYRLIQLGKAEILENEKNIKKSIKLYSEIINENKKGELIYLLGIYGRAIVYKQNNEFDKAIYDYNDMLLYTTKLNEIKLLPDHLKPSNIFEKIAELYNRIYTRKKNIDYLMKAIDVYSKAIKINSDDENLYYRRAELYERIKNNKKAIRDYSVVIKNKNKKSGILEIHWAYEKRMNLYLNNGKLIKYLINRIWKNRVNEKWNTYFAELIVGKPPKFYIY